MSSRNYPPVLYTSFIGNKRNRVNDIRRIMTNGSYERVLEPFGGSCCISVNLGADGYTAVANDYDHYFDGFETMLDHVDILLEEIHEQGWQQSNSPLPAHRRRWLQDRAQHYTPKERKYLAKWFMFSARRVNYDGQSVKGFAYYRCQFDGTTTRDRHYAATLRRHVTLDHSDWADFLNRHATPGDTHTLIVLDPPYLNAATKAYRHNYFTLADTIRLLNTMRDLGSDFVLFNQKAEDMQALLDVYGFDYETSTRPVMAGGGADREDFQAWIRQQPADQRTGQATIHDYLQQAS